MEQGMDHKAAHAWIERLTALGRDVRTAIVRDRGASGLDQPVAFEGGDTIYEIDKRVEPLILSHAARWAASVGPIELVAEGLNEHGRAVVGGSPDREVVASVLIDPIDGTRNIMYDKRSAWFLGAVAPGSGGTLGGVGASVMIELPTSKANRCDEFSSTGDGAAVCTRVRLDDNGVTIGHVAVPFSPSPVETLRHGWAQVVNFFPGTKVLAADLMERIATGTLGEIRAGEALVFDDQYLTTGGQLVELISGRDRFCCDLRPLMFEIVRASGGEVARGLCCHPYDMAGLLIAKRAGVIVTDGFGRGLDAPFAVDHDVHWCGYANGSLRGAIEPIIQQWLRDHGVAIPN